MRPDQISEGFAPVAPKMSKEEVLAVLDADRAHANNYRILFGVIGSTPRAMDDESVAARATVEALWEERDFAVAEAKAYGERLDVMTPMVEALNIALESETDRATRAEAR